MLKHTLSTIPRKPVSAKSPDCQLIYLWCIRVADRGRVKISHQSITSILTWDEAVSVSTHSTLSAWLHKRWDPSCWETTDSWNGRQVLMAKRYHLDFSVIPTGWDYWFLWDWKNFPSLRLLSVHQIQLKSVKRVLKLLVEEREVV